MVPGSLKQSNLGTDRNMTDTDHSKCASPPSHDEQIPENGVENHVGKDSTTAAPITFIDPVGTRWEFPYDDCKTWKDMALLVKEVFVDCSLPDWLVERFESYQPGDRNRNFLMKRLNNERTVILPSHWDKLAKPGWEITVEFTGYDIVSKIRREKEEAREKEEEKERREKEWEEMERREKEWEEKEREEKEREEKEREEKEKISEETSDEDTKIPVEDKLVPRSYLIQFFQRDRTSIPDFVCEKSYSDLLLTKSIPNQKQEIPAVFQIIKKILYPPKDRHRERTEYEIIEETDIVSNPIIRIQSLKLLNALKDIISATSEPDADPNLIGFNMRSEDPTESDIRQGVFHYPYKDLYHYKEELIEYKKGGIGTSSFHSEEYNRECHEHIDILIEYLSDEQSIGIRTVEELLREEKPKIRFNKLWLLFKPNTTVFMKDKFGLNAYVIDEVTGGQQGESHKPYLVVCWNLEFDGNHLDRALRYVSIPVFDGEKEVTTLPIYPTKYHKDEDGYKAKLIERGKLYIATLFRPTYHEYSGPSHYYGTRKFDQVLVVVDHISQPWCNEISVKQTMRKSLYVPNRYDNEELGTRNRIRNCECETCQSLDQKDRRPQRMIFDDYKEIELHSDTSLTDHQYMLCSSHVYGFLLKDRIWDCLEVQGLQATKLQTNIIDNLVMDPSNKDIIKSVCDTFSAAQGKVDMFFGDFVKGKGEGHIILLHGPPGTGKTLTAESVAESTGRPLLSVTAADLGHEPISLEANLLKFFRNATRWDGIVLLDEADIYLQRRANNDLLRNSVVSVFLRALDYFQGILFITTNRVGVFDEAFMSRIHLQIGYNALDQAARTTIWDAYLDKLKHNKKQGGAEFQIDYQVKKYIQNSPELKDLEWNGREIRNAFQTAVALASSDAKKEGNAIAMLTPDHIDKVVTMATNFKKYMKDTLKNSQEELAAIGNLRAPPSQGHKSSSVAQF